MLRYLAMIILIIICSSDSFGRSYSNTSICKLINHKHEMNNHYVHLVVIYTTDLIERSTLTDPDCSGNYLTPYNLNNNNIDKSISKFENSIIGNIFDNKIRRFKVEMLGKFVWIPDDIYSGRIYIEKIIGFQQIKDDK